MRVIGIDYGRKRVGLAMADPFRMFAQTIGTYSPDLALIELLRINRESGIELIVMGWPLNLDGEENAVTQWVQEYIRRIEKKLPGVPVVKYDERYSSRRASSALVDAGIKKKARAKKGRLDAAAAAIILQDYLDEVRDDHTTNDPSADGNGAT